MICIVSTAKTNDKIFNIGDLVIFSGVSQQELKNQIGIVIGDSASTATDKIFTENEWYIVQFGSMKLIVNDTMIEKLEEQYERDI